MYTNWMNQQQPPNAFGGGGFQGGPQPMPQPAPQPSPFMGNLSQQEFGSVQMQPGASGAPFAGGTFSGTNGGTVSNRPMPMQPIQSSPFNGNRPYSPIGQQPAPPPQQYSPIAPMPAQPPQQYSPMSPAPQPPMQRPPMQSSPMAPMPAAPPNGFSQGGFQMGGNTTSRVQRPAFNGGAGGLFGMGGGR